MKLKDFFAAPVPSIPSATPQIMAADIEPWNNDNLGAFYAGVPFVTRAEAMSVPTVARCIGVFKTIASLPMHTRIIATGEKVNQPRVISQPDPRISGVVFWSWIIDDMKFHPYAYARVLDRYADTGRIRAMERIDPDRVTVLLNRLGTAVEAYRVDGFSINPIDLVVFTSPDEGLLARAGQTILAATALERAARDFAENPSPPMLLTPNGMALPKDKVANLLDRFKARRAKSGSVAFVNADLKLERFGFDPKSLQMNEARNYVALELTRAVGLPAYFADAQQSSFTYSNALDKRRDLVDFAFRNIMSAIEQRMSFQDFTPLGQEVRFDLDDFLRGNPLERAQVYKILNEIRDVNGNPAMTIGEIREEEDMLL